VSTTFGIKTPDGEVRPIARRVGVGNEKVFISIDNPWVSMLPLDTEVIPMDNSAQGIHTLEDLFNKEKENDE
jgi:hypothetical protein